MTESDVIKFLRQHKESKRAAQTWQNNIKFFQNEIEGLHRRPRGSRRTQAHLLRLEKEARDYIRQSERNLEKALARCAEIEKAINSLQDPTQRKILTMRYIDCRKWETIADTVIYSAQNTHRIHNKAISILSEIIE